MGNNRRGLVKENGGKIVLDGKTVKNGVALFKRLAFKGKTQNHNLYNKCYNFMSNNGYKIADTTDEGKNLSIISK